MYVYIYVRMIRLEDYRLILNLERVKYHARGNCIVAFTMHSSYDSTARDHKDLIGAPYAHFEKT